MKSSRAVALRSDVFRKEREASWRALERLLTKVERDGLQSLSPEDMTHITALNRAAASSLGVARAISLDKNLIEYLEGLCARSYFSIYAAKRPLGRALADFFAQRFPAAVRNLRWYVLVSAAFLLLGTLVGYVQTSEDQDRYFGFVSEGMAQGRDPLASTEYLREGLYDGEEHDSDRLGAFSSFLFTHNSQVGMLAFALGFAAGLPVFWLLFTNGLMLGAFAALYGSRGLALDLWAWILPHGVTELLAVVLCGAGGLVVARALVLPGRHTRLVSLARRGREAGVLVLGSVAMLFVAALIEGFFRQLVTAVPARLAVIAVTTVFWALYFGFAGRRARA